MDLAERYVLWNLSGAGSYTIDDVEATGIESFEWNNDIPLAARWPDDARCTLEGGNPKKPKLSDSLSNYHLVRVISKRLKTALEKLEVTDVEYLPVKLFADDKELVTEFYFVNFLNPPDCLDLKASKAEMSGDKTNVERIKRLVLKSDPERAMFKLANYKDVVIVRMDVVEALSEIGFSGIMWLPLFNHPDFDNSREGSPIWLKVRALYEKIYKKGKPIVLADQGTPAGKLELVKVPRDLKPWLKSLRGKVTVNDDAFVPAPGDDVWLDSYNDDKDSWPAFEPKRYYAIGTNENGNYWLLDLGANAAVVYYSHEVGYDPKKNFSKVAASLAELKKLIE